MSYKPQVVQGQMSVWLQCCGWHAARQAGDVGVGDVLVYNFGSTGTVISIEKETASTVTFKVQTSDGRIWEQRKNKATWVAVVESDAVTR